MIKHFLWLISFMNNLSSMWYISLWKFIWDIVSLIIGQILYFNNLFTSSNHPLFKKLFSFLKEANSYAYSRDKLPHTHTHFPNLLHLLPNKPSYSLYLLPLLEQHMFHIYVLSWTYLVHLGIRLNPEVYPFNWILPLGIRLNPKVYPFDWILPFGIGLNPKVYPFNSILLPGRGLNLEG
jgi:hypothetical protein